MFYLFRYWFIRLDRGCLSLISTGGSASKPRGTRRPGHHTSVQPSRASTKWQNILFFCHIPYIWMRTWNLSRWVLDSCHVLSFLPHTNGLRFSENNAYLAKGFHFAALHKNIVINLCFPIKLAYVLFNALIFIYLDTIFNEINRF